jgi:photosystem II stability/assembly factor-like uncharacterized protein
MSRALRGAGGVAVAFAALALWTAPNAAQSGAVDIAMFRELSWRLVGPFRGGRTTTAAGVASQPNVFYFGTANGGVWKTTDAGRVWTPLFDDQAVASIGAVAVAPSNPDIIYVGTGEAPWTRDSSTGTGMYRSADGGRTWTALGLSDSRHIPAVVVDPRVPDRVFVAATGSMFGESAERGVYRSLNGGRVFERVLFANADTGALDVVFDPADPAVVYATLIQARLSPWGGATLHGSGTGLHKSLDGGTTWHPLTVGLPTFPADGLRVIRVAVAPANRQRLFAAVSAATRGGLYRSDDAGATWTLVNANPGIAQDDSGRVSVAVDPANAEIVYVTGARVERSVDGGRTFDVWRSDAAGTGYRAFWMNPSARGVAVLAGDRGAIVTVNGGQTWSSELNQPTGQYRQIATDNSFPYRICGAERSSAPGCLPSRNYTGDIPPGAWRSVAAANVGSFVSPDPQDPDLIYSGSIGRFDRRTGQTQDVRPPEAPGDRRTADAPIVFAADGRTLYYGTALVWRTNTGGQNWTAISPDLARDRWDVPVNVGAYRAIAEAQPRPRGSISALAPSPIDGRTIWAGTNDGLVHVTRDAGTTWADVSPPALAEWARVSSLEASHFDTNTAYAAADATGLDDTRPLLWRTRDGGATWTAIGASLPAGAVVNAVREDPFRRGLLFAATDRSVFVSFDDGDRWQTLRINLPATSITDLVIKDTDLVAASDGRGLWVLDDISAFRQVTSDVARADVFLFRPPNAWRVRSVAGTTAPREEPAGSNPPSGVPLSYVVGAGAGPLTLEIIETVTGEVIRRFSSAPAEALDDPSLEPSPRLSADPGFHRVVWDLKYPSIDGQSMWVMPGTYQVRLTAGSRVARQAVVVRMDPRVRTATPDLAAQFTLSKSVEERRREVAAVLAKQRRSATGGEGSVLRDAARELTRVLEVLQQSDTRPTPVAEAAAAAAIDRANAALATVVP